MSERTGVDKSVNSGADNAVAKRLATTSALTHALLLIWASSFKYTIQANN